MNKQLMVLSFINTGTLVTSSHKNLSISAKKIGKFLKEKDKPFNRYSNLISMIVLNYIKFKINIFFNILINMI